MKKASKGKILLIMADGFGVPAEGWGKSVFREFCGRRFTELFERHSIPLDATLGVEGIPQSATGQTSLFTGVNAAKALGRHVQGFPGPALRKMISAGNLFSKALEGGHAPLFANAYVRYGLKELEESGLRSVTTVMAAQALGRVMGKEELLRSEAVFHDLTRESLEAGWGAPIISPEAAAKDLIGIAERSSLTLFEYFMTDRAGHKCDREFLGKVLSEFGRFVLALADGLPPGMTLVLTSDHGNCEDISIKAHTKNPVPLLLLNSPLPPPESLKDIAGAASFILEILSAKNQGNVDLPGMAL